MDIPVDFVKFNAAPQLDMTLNLLVEGIDKVVTATEDTLAQVKEIVQRLGEKLTVEVDGGVGVFNDLGLPLEVVAIG